MPNINFFTVVIILFVALWATSAQKMQTQSMNCDYISFQAGDGLSKDKAIAAAADCMKNKNTSFSSSNIETEKQNKTTSDAVESLTKETETFLNNGGNPLQVRTCSTIICK